MKIIKINTNDIIIDQKNISDLINRNCFGKTKRIVSGAYLKNDNLIVWMSPRNADIDITNYVLTQLNDPSEGVIIAEIKNRFVYGFSIVAFFEINDKLWALLGRIK
jgi:hypothetical protein